MLRLLAPQKESNLILAYPAKPNKPIHRNIIASGLAFDLSSRCAVDCRQGRATGVSNYLSDGGGGGSVRFTRGGQGRTAHLLLHKSESQSQNGGEKCQGILAQTPREMMTRRNILIEILIEAEGVTYSTVSKDLPRTSYTGTVHSNLNQG